MKRIFFKVYNLFYTSLPVLGLGIFEQDVSDKHSIEYPKLYTPGLTNALFNTKEFVKSVIHGVFSSLILFFIPFGKLSHGPNNDNFNFTSIFTGTYREAISPEGHVLSDHMLLGVVVATILIIDNTAQVSKSYACRQLKTEFPFSQIALDTSYWTVFNHIMIWGSLLWYFTLDSFYNYVIGGPYVASLAKAITGSTFWLTMILTVFLLMVPVLAWRFYSFDSHPSLADRIRMQQRQSKLSRSKPTMVRTPSARRSRRSLRSSYAFAHEVKCLWSFRDLK